MSPWSPFVVVRPHPRLVDQNGPEGMDSDLFGEAFFIYDLRSAEPSGGHLYLGTLGRRL
jgi:hypothetical protein